MNCQDCGHAPHSGCSQCDDLIPMTPNGWDGGHSVHSFAPNQGRCEVAGCKCGYDCHVCGYPEEGFDHTACD